MNAIWRWSFALAPVALVLGFLWFADPWLGRGLDYQQNMAVAGVTVVGALLVVALFVERSMAVVNALLFGEKERQARLDLLQAEMGGSDPSGSEQEIKELLDNKERLRLLMSFAAGLFVSAAGVRTLQGLLVTTVNDAQLPLNPMFVTVDIVLTAGLIAGGSNTLAVLAQRLKDLAQNNDDDDGNGGGGDSVIRNTAPAPVKQLKAPRGRPASRKPIRRLNSRLL